MKLTAIFFLYIAYSSSFDDPSLVQGTKEERLIAFRHTRDEIHRQMKIFYTYNMVRLNN